MLFLLDTNMASYIIKGNIPAVRRRLVKIPMVQVCVSTVTVAELRYGVAKRPESLKLKLLVDEFLIRTTVMPWESEAAEQYGQLRASLEKEGRLLGNLDLMIAAHALALEATLVTHDAAFARVHGLVIEDWTRYRR